MTEAEAPVAKVEAARPRVLEGTLSLSCDQRTFKPSAERGSVVAEILEHLVLAETGSINFIWRGADGVQGSRVHR